MLTYSNIHKQITIKNWKIHGLTLILFFSVLIPFAQNINGIALDKETNKPLKGVHVYIKNTNKGTLTNKNGAFKLSESKINKKDTISFSHIGYKSVNIPYQKFNKNYKIYFVKSINRLNEVGVVKKIKLKTSIRFNKLASMPTELHSFGSLLIDNKIYVLGGDITFEVDGLKKAANEHPNLSLFDHLQLAKQYWNYESYTGKLSIYDIKQNKWLVNDKQKFGKRAYHNLNYHKNKIYVIGGKRLARNRNFEFLDNKIEILNLKTKTIAVDNTNPHQAINFASFVFNDNILIMGGSTKMKNNKKTFSNKVHVYSLKTGYWYQLKNMPTAKETTGVLIDNKIYLIGGFNNESLTSIESFDLITGKWEKESDLFNGITAPAITYKDNIIYIFNDGNIYTYNINTKELNKYFIRLFLKSSKLFYTNNKLYILGGYLEDKDNSSVSPSSKLYTIEINEFNITKINKSKRTKVNL